MVLADQIRDTVQNLPDAEVLGASGVGGFWAFDQAGRSPILSAWGTRQRERDLRRYDRDPYNTLWQGAISGLISKVIATPHELKGGRNLTNRYDTILRYAHFRGGFDHFLSLLLRDYFRFDGGAYAEIIAPGKPTRPITGKVIGLAHLDSFNCLPTGDPEFPVVYCETRPNYRNNKKGNVTLHLMHHTRILHMVDLPDGDQNNPGYGLCALSRAIAIVERQLWMGRYIVANLDDKPSPGLVVVNNGNREDRNKAFSLFRGEQDQDMPPEWGKVAWFFSVDPSKPLSIDMVNFSRPPEKFDYPVYVNVDVNELALALGVDKQELWELSGGNIGSSGQSEIQHRKSQGRTYGRILSSLERLINSYVLPDSLEFQWKVRDPYEAQEQAANAQLWTGIAIQLEPVIGRELAMEILANQVEAVADAIVDEEGNLVRLPDFDVTPPGESQNADTPEGESQPTDETTAQDSTPNEGTQTKAIQATRLDFESAFDDLLSGARDGSTNKRRFGVILRDLLRLYGDRAFRDGLVDGGIEDAELDEDDRATYLALLANQSQYVSGFADTLYSSGISDGMAAGKAAMWYTKSIAPFYDSGRLSADKNGYYQFIGDDGAESCKTCQRLKGQVHRFKDWSRKRLRPGVDTDNFECGGFKCEHRLKKAESGARASGKW